MVPLPRVTDGWDVSNTTLWSPTLLYVESLQQTHIVQKSVVQQLVQCKDVSLVHHQPSDTHTPLCCPTTALVTPYCGDQKDLSLSRQIELLLCRCQLRCKVTSDRLKAPSSKSECSEWTLSLSRTVGCFWRIGYNSCYRQISYKPAESFLLECLLLFSLLRLWRAALQMGLIESRAAFKPLLIKRQSLSAMMAVPSPQWRSSASVKIISR